MLETGARAPSAPRTLILSRRERAKVEMSILPVEEGADWGIQNLFLGRCAATSLQKGMLVEEVANRGVQNLLLGRCAPGVPKTHIAVE